MLVCISGVLGRADVAGFRRSADAHDREDGPPTERSQSALVKHDQQLPPASEVLRAPDDHINSALTGNPPFVAAAIPLRISPPLLNRHVAAQCHPFGSHVDKTVRGDDPAALRIRTDLSATLFAAEPDEYDGGELLGEAPMDHAGSSCRPEAS